MTREELLKKEWANEDQMTADCWQYAHNTYQVLRGLIFHVPNGGKRTPQEAMKFKAMGVVPGIPDLINLYRHVCGLEAKMEKGRISDAQHKIKICWEVNGIPIYYFYNASEFLAILEKKILQI